MKALGKVLFTLGAGSLALRYFGMGRDSFLLNWIDHWGDETGWAIRATLAILGGMLYFTFVWIDWGESSGGAAK